MENSPLAGLKVLDFSTLIPGPFGTQMLADLGADVIRIEAPDRPDLVRDMPPHVDGVSASHASINRNKKSVAINLKHPQARPILQTLIRQSDVLVEQNRPGVMDRLGYGYEAASTLNSRLVYCSITGYGQTGPLKDKAGHDINYLSLSGLASFSGRAETGPVLSGTQIADFAGGAYHAVMGILAAIVQRGRTGKGQHVDVSMSDAALTLTTIFGANFLASGREPGLSRESLNGGMFYDFYETRDNRYLSVGSLEPQFSINLFTALGQVDWHARAMNYQDLEDQAKLKTQMRERFKEKSLAEWIEIFSKTEACVEPVLTLSEVQKHPHFQARGMFVRVPNHNGKMLDQIANPLKFSDAQPQYHSAGRPLGADTSAVLKACGFSDERLDEWRSTGVIA